MDGGIDMPYTPDEIRIERLHVYAYHGVYAEEKEKGQDFYVSCSLFLDLHEAGRTDDLTKGVSYALVCDLIEREMTKEKYDLIEKAADTLCFAILKEFPLIKKAVVTVSKPNAPVHSEVSDLSVTLSRERTKVFLSYGSNMGDKEDFIEEAIYKIGRCPYMEDVKCSHNYVTAPYGYLEQDTFVNGVLEAVTLFTPYELLDYLHTLEAEAGRERKIHWGPRTLDLDILLFGDLVMNTEKLTIPHADMANRKFVLEPLSELAGWVIHPVLHKSVNEMYATLLQQEEQE